MIILRRWWVVLLTAVLAAGIAWVYSDSQPRTYQTDLRLMAIADPPDYWLDLYAKNRLASYRDLIGNWEFVSSAIETANLDVDPGHAMNALTLGHNPDSNVVQLVVTDNDPERAASIINALADAFVAQSEADNELIREGVNEDTDGRGTIEIVKLDTPSAPADPVGPRVRLNTIAALILGLGVGVLLTFGGAYVEDVLRSPSEIRRELGIPILVNIPPDHDK